MRRMLLILVILVLGTISVFAYTPLKQCEPICGNGIVEEGEVCDFGINDGVCELDPVPPSSCVACLDCHTIIVGDIFEVCGDGYCSEGVGETYLNCPADCEPDFQDILCLKRHRFCRIY